MSVHPGWEAGISLGGVDPRLTNVGEDVREDNRILLCFFFIILMWQVTQEGLESNRISD